MSAPKVVDFKRRRDLTPVEIEPTDVTHRRLLEELAQDGSVLERGDAEFWVQTFLDHGVRPSLDAVRAFMAEYQRMWERLNRKTWSEHEWQERERVERLRFICTAVHAAQACGKYDQKIGAKHYEQARRLLMHFGIPERKDRDGYLYHERLTADAIAQMWRRFGKRVRPDHDLLDIFIYAQRNGLCTAEWQRFDYVESTDDDWS